MMSCAAWSSLPERRKSPPLGSSVTFQSQTRSGDACSETWIFLCIEKEAWSLRISKACLPSSWTSWRCGSPAWTESSQPLGTGSRVVLKSTTTVLCPQATLASLPQSPHSITPIYHSLRQRIGLFLPAESQSGAIYAFPGGSRTIRGVTVAKGVQASSLYALIPSPVGGHSTALMAALDGEMTRHDVVGRDVL